jgi:hypothetical protein
MRTRKFSATFVPVIVVVTVTICIIATCLAVYGFVVDLATSPIAINFANAYENSIGLQHEIESAYPAESVLIRYEEWPYHRGQWLTITLVNSTASQLTTEEQRAQAERIARLAWQNKKVNTEVRFISITFLKRTEVLGIPFCHRDSYRFIKADLIQE